MTAWERARRLPIGAEIAAAFAAGAGSFAVAAVALASIGPAVLVALVGLAYVGAVIAIALRVGIVYAVPVAMAGLLAFDWYSLPPTHALEFPDSANLLDVIVYLTVAVLLGELAAHAARRATAAERARGEIADEQAALRRVATVVAQSAPADELFATVAAEAGGLLGVDAVRIGRYEDEAQLVHVAEWSRPDYEPPAYDRAPLDGRSVSAEVLRTARAARIDDYDHVAERAVFARDTGLKSVVGAPVVVEGRLWGVMIASSGSGALPADTDARLSDFAELVATAISNTEAWTRTARLADEQAALRRVATLVAEDAPPAAVFAKVAEEVGHVLGDVESSLWKDEGDGTATVVAVSGIAVDVGTRLPTDGDGVIATVLRERRPYSIGDYAERSGAIVEHYGELARRSHIGCPIIVGGRLWGALSAGRTAADPFPPGTETRLAQFAELVATAIANAQARGELSELAHEQAALRRVATLVARGTPPEPVFHTVADEVVALVGGDTAAIVRFEPDGTGTIMGAHQARRAPGTRFEPDPDYVVASVRDSGRAARFDTDDPAAADMPEAVRLEGIRSALASPIVVEGELWGAITVASLHGALPSGTERRLAGFTELAATAIANTESRARVERLTDEQVALRRVATLVAKEASLPEVFARVAEEASQALGDVDCGLWRDEGDGTAILVAVSGSGPGSRIGVGMRTATDGDSVIGFAQREGRPGRILDYSNATGSAAEGARELGIRSSLACPVFVGQRTWGAMQVVSYDDEPIPPETETRIARFSDLVATAIANAEARAEVQRLADEQAALRRVATLVAQDVPATELFDAVAREVGTLLGGDFAGLARFEDQFVVTVGVWAAEGEHPPVPPRWPMQAGDPATTIAQAREATRWSDWSDVPGPIAAFIREIGIRSSVGTPIVVEGSLWGALALHSKHSASFPPDTETRMQAFTDLVGTAIANAQARGDLSELAQEQTALRHVATLVAQGTRPESVFRAVADEVAELLGPNESVIVRFEGETTATVLASRGDPDPPGRRVELEPGFVVRAVRETRRSARFDTDDPAGPDMPELVRTLGIRSAVASPVVVEGELWGAVAVVSRDRRLPAAAERRLTAFTELVATAVANTQAREQVRTLADEQAALRRVATLVAQEASAEQVLTAIAEECGRLFGIDDIGMLRYEGDESVVLAITGRFVDTFPVGTRLPLGGESAASRVFRTRASVRLEDDAPQGTGSIAEPARSLGLRSVIGIPIIVEGRMWGAIIIGASRREPLPPDTESRVGQFTELMATTVANTESRARADRLADEQAALRRVATLVAQGADATTVFDAVAREVEGQLPADIVMVGRYEPGAELTVLAHRGSSAQDVPAGMRISHAGDTVANVVRDTELPARIERDEGARGVMAEFARAAGARVAVGAPVVVDGRLWGVVSAGWIDEQAPPAETEHRMAQFAQLLATAIANADSRDQLTASRARLLTAADEARRRVVRDLHDGAQQRLVHTIVTLKLAQQALREEDGEANVLVGQALENAQHGNEELRELAHGILPSVLTTGGLRSGVRSLMTRLEVPVRVAVPAERFPGEVEASAYFVVAEALTNVAKHAQAEHAEVTASADDAALRVEIRDDGQGGADPSGHGLVGIADRVAAHGGRLEVESPPGRGTRVTATFPL